MTRSERQGDAKGDQGKSGIEIDTRAYHDYRIIDWMKQLARADNNRVRLKKRPQD